MIADLGYALSTAGYALLLLLLLTVRKPGLAKHLLLLATATTCLWSLSQIQLLFGTNTLPRLLLLDNVKHVIWVLFLSACLKDNFKSLSEVLKRPVTWAALSVPLLFTLLLRLLPVQENVLLLGQTVIALEILVLLEIIYRQADADKWAYKPLVIYLGATSLYEFATFANASMVNYLDYAYFQARGYIYFACLPFLVFAIRRIQHWGVNIFISRDVVLHSSLLIAAGGYLLFMAGAGYLVRYLGGEWGASVQIILIFSSLALLMTLFLSNQFRNRVKVFITKHFFANQFDYRIEWVKLTQRLSRKQQGLEGVYQNALKSTLEVIEYQSGTLVKCQANGRLQSVASVNAESLSENEVQIVGQIEQFCRQQHWIIDLDELRVKPYAYEGMRVNYEFLSSCHFQLVLPIYDADQLWGMVLVGPDEHHRRSLNWELRDYLNAVTAQITTYLLQNEASKEIAENAQFAAFSRMSAFVVHDLKNVLAQIDLILANAQQHKDNPEFIDDTFETLEHTRSRMGKMLKQLTDKNAASEQVDGVFTLSAIIQSVLNEKCATLLPKPKLEVINEKPVVIDQDKFANVMYHLVSNAQQATDDNGTVSIQVDMALDQSQLLVRIVDTGTGMSEAFIRERLFKPFDTTKGNAGMGIGAYDAKNYLEKLGGQLLVESALGQGSTFTLVIPLN